MNREARPVVTRTRIDEFLACKTLALAGVSRSGKGFGNSILKELSAKGYRILPVHPETREIGGLPTAASLAEIADQAEGLIICTPAAQTEQLVAEAVAVGIDRIWIQQGAESEKALGLCRQAGMDTVHGECILMFAEPAALIHRLHRGLWSLFGKLPPENPSNP